MDLAYIRMRSQRELGRFQIIKEYGAGKGFWRKIGEYFDQHKERVHPGNDSGVSQKQQ